MVDICFVQFLDNSHFHFVLLFDGPFEKEHQIPKKLSVLGGIPKLALKLIDDDVLKDLFRDFAYLKDIFLL